MAKLSFGKQTSSPSAIAENQANTLDLFLSRRLVNISNLIDDPKFQVPPAPGIMRGYSEKPGKKTTVGVSLIEQYWFKTRTGRP